MATKTYTEKLKDPRWQKRRLEILEQRGWKCERCAAADRTLHVHHGCYIKGRDPWEYPDFHLTVFCESCHEEVTGLLQRISLIVSRSAPWRQYLLLAQLENSWNVPKGFDILTETQWRGDACAEHQT